MDARSKNRQRSAEIHVGNACAASCEPCDCRYPATAPQALEALLERGGSRLVIRGGASTSPQLGRIVERARTRGFDEIAVRLSAAGATGGDPGEALARLGVDSAIVPLFSQRPAVHDRIVGRRGALVRALVEMRAVAAAGLAVEIEAPVLSPKLQDLCALLELAQRAVPVRRARLFLPRHEVSPAVSPPAWSEAAGPLAAAIALARKLDVALSLRTDDGVPLCALRSHAELLDAYRFDPRRVVSRTVHDPEECRRCAVRNQCCGIQPSYARRHGAADIVAYRHRPRAMYEQRSTPKAAWTAARRAAAAKVNLIVLRPTVNCNQDCTFCSANETSRNVWTSSDVMFRAIARAARLGVRRLAFSGGEPTLSKDLVRYVAAASRLQISAIEIVTNAVLLDRAEKVEALRKAGLTHAFVSLHAHSEALSCSLTQKRGDFARTVRAVQLMLDAGVEVSLNHVITTRNLPYLRAFVDFVHAEFARRVLISFAFVTPQYKALEHIELMPRLSEVAPELRRAMRRALSLDQPFSVGSRQGIPPCFLGEFRAWSDVVEFVAEAQHEDAPQKQQAPACARCRYRAMCPGLWTPYIQRFGFDELRPVEGPPLTGADLEAIRATYVKPWGVPRSFEHAAEVVRDRDAEQAPLAPEVPTPAARLSLPVVHSTRSRPVRVLMVGTGGRARRMASALRTVEGLTLGAVASPHALSAELSAFGGCPAYASATEAMDDVRPEAVVVASSRTSRGALIREALLRQLPVLAEAPIAANASEARSLERLAASTGVPLLATHAVLFSRGLATFLAQGPFRTVSCLRRISQRAPEAVLTWSRPAFERVLYETLAPLARVAGRGEAEVVSASSTGVGSPERARVALRWQRTHIELSLDLTASADVMQLVAVDAAGRAHEWTRVGGNPGVGRVRPGEDGELSGALRHFHEVVTLGAAPSTQDQEGADLMQVVERVLAALADAGAPFQRDSAPIHVSSPDRA